MLWSLIVFIGISAFLLLKLNDLLGQHIGNTDDLQIDAAADKKNKTVNGESRDIEHPYDVGYLNDIHQVFQDFVKDDFIKKSKAAFGIIFNAYSRSDISEIKDLVADNVFKAFKRAISEQDEKKRVISSLNRIDSAEIIDGSVVDGVAYITVRYEIEQNNSMINDGCESSSCVLEKATHEWEFCRHQGSRTWLLCNINYAQ